MESAAPYQPPSALLTAIEDVFLLGLGERDANGTYLTAALRDSTVARSYPSPPRWTLETGNWSLIVDLKRLSLLRPVTETVIAVQLHGLEDCDLVDLELLRAVDLTSSGMLVAGLIEGRDWSTLERLEEVFPDLMDRHGPDLESELTGVIS